MVVLEVAEEFEDPTGLLLKVHLELHELLLEWLVNDGFLVDAAQ